MYFVSFYISIGGVLVVQTADAPSLLCTISKIFDYLIDNLSVWILMKSGWRIALRILIV